LEDAVRSTATFSNWRADYSPASLGALGEWFAANVTTRPRSAAELEQIYRGGPAWFRGLDVPSEELSECTFSLGFDIGMYFGEVLRTNVPNVKWRAHAGVKHDVDEGQPVLEGFGHAFFNPVRIVVTLAYGLADGSKSGSRLLELYEIWRGFALRAGSR
jgi:hypothetical protein